MASSFPFSLDLNLAPPTQTWGRGAAPVWMPYFASSRGPVTVDDSILLDSDVAVGVARSLITPRDVRVLGTKDENRVVNDAMAQSVQSAAYVASVCCRLIAKSREVELLRAHLVAERKLVEECQGIVKSLKRERLKTAERNRCQLEALLEENKQLSKMVNLYSQDMRKKLEVIDRPGKRKQLDPDASRAQAKSVNFGSSSDEPQEVVRDNPEDDVQKAKLKAPMVESQSAVNE